MNDDDAERLRRWRLVLGEAAQGSLGLGDGLGAADLGMDDVLAALYGGRQAMTRQAGLGASAPNVARWLGDIRTYFPVSAVRVMQQDALDRLNLTQMLLEPELLATVEPDVPLVATLLALGKALPEATKETARMVVRRVVDDLERRLANPLIQAVRGSLNRVQRTRRPRHQDINWDRTIRANLKHYQRDRRQLIVEQLIGYDRKQSALRDIVLCVDESGSMGTSVVYSGIFGAVLASVRAIQTRMVVFDTAVVDLTEDLHDPVDLLFGVQLGGGTDINRALGYCQGIITRPEQTILVLITDLYEGGDAREMMRRAAELVASGVQVICLLALNDQGAPIYHHQIAAQFASLGIASFACTPDRFPELMAAAITRQDIGQWAARQGMVTARSDEG